MNYYALIISLVALGGVVITAWGWRVMQQTQKKKQWPTTAGAITESKSTSEHDDLLPHIVFSYVVADKTYEQTFQFPEGTNPLPEFAQSYVKKYPVGRAVQVYYNPNQPQDSTIEPGAQGDWMILVLGILMTAGAITTFLIV